MVPEIVVPDQLESAVSKPNRHDPEINPTYAEMAAHYGTVVISARPRKARDKATVEVGVQGHGCYAQLSHAEPWARCPSSRTKDAIC